MISNNIEITVYIANLCSPLAVKQLINNTCQLKGVCNQACLVWLVCLFILSYLIKMCVCVAADEEIDIHIDIFMMHLLTPWVWNDWVNFSPMMTVIQIFRDFKPILELDLYGEHMPEERIDVNLSARSTYMWVYMWGSGLGIGQFFLEMMRMIPILRDFNQINR